jgi:hypothetical protein
MDALARANEFRFAQAKVKREIKEGKRTASEVLRQCPFPEELGSMLPEKLLRSAYRFQRKMAYRYLAQLEIQPTRRLGQFTYRQRVKLAEKVEVWEVRNPSDRRPRPRLDSGGSVSGVGRVA